MKLNDVGLVVGGRDLAGGVFELPRIYERNDITMTPQSRPFQNTTCPACKKDRLHLKRFGCTGNQDNTEVLQKQATAVQKSIHVPFISLHISLTRKYIFNARSQCNSSELEMETKQRRTRFILVLDVVAGYDAVAVEPLRPPQVHAAIFDLSNLQLRGIRGFCEQNAGKTTSNG